MSAAAKTVTNEDLMEVIQDMMQMTSDGFGQLNLRMDRIELRMDRIEARMDRLETRMDSIEARMSELESTLREHTLEISALKAIVQDLSNSHKAYINDISDILDRITVLENRKPQITKEEFQELQNLMRIVIEWARQAAKTIKTPIKIPS
jgi:chromosome segregation ATPase